MSLVPLLTHGSKKQNLWVPYFSTGQLNASTISTGNITANTAEISSIVAQYLSTIAIDAEYINNSTINTLHVDLDGQILTASATELLLNGIPVATQSSLSTIADWSLDPAISTVQMAGNDLDQGGTLSSLNVRAGNGFFLNLVAFNSLFVSTQTSTLSTLEEIADLGIFSTLNAGTISSGLILADTVSSSQGYFGGMTTPSAIIEPLGQLRLQTNGPSFSTGTGSAVLGFGWDPANSLNSDMFYDTTISSLHIMTKTGSGYVDTPASKLYVQELNTSSLTVSSINGSEFTSTGITVQVAGVSSLVANSISSLGAEIRNALVSTIQFKPSFDVGLNFDTAALGNALQGGLTRLGIGAGAGLGIVGSGLLGAVFSRPSATSYNTNAYYQYAVPTQLQFSTLGAYTSTFTRLVSSSGAGNEVPGVEIVLSSIISSGTLCIRSLGDPTNLADPSTFTSSIQAFGEWVPVPPEVVAAVSTFASASVSSLEVSSINGAAYPPPAVIPEDWALYPAVSTIAFSTGVTAVVAASAGSDIALTGQSVKLIAGYTDAQNLLVVSSISTGTLYGANDNLFGIGLPGLKIDAPNLFFSTVQTNITGLINCSSITANSISSKTESISSLYAFDTQGQNLTINNKITSDIVWARQMSTAVILAGNNNLFGTGVKGIEIDATNAVISLKTSTTIASGNLTTGDLIANTSVSAPLGVFNSAQVSSLAFAQAGAFGLSSLMWLSTSQIPGTGTSTTTYMNTDLSLLQNDLYCQQLRVGYANTGGSALSEIIMYAPTVGGTSISFNVGNLDRTARIQSTQNAGFGGYILDTTLNPPFFSTINNSTCMMSYFPSTIANSIGYSTISIIPPIQVYGGFYSSTTQVVAGANTITPLTYNSQSVNVGGITFAGSTINVPIAGTYEITHSIQFDTTSGGTNEAFFWLKKNGTDIPQSASIVSVVNNGETLGTISLIDTAAAGDQYAVCIASADTNMTAKAFPISSFCPAIPSLITNLKRLG